MAELFSGLKELFEPRPGRPAELELPKQHPDEEVLMAYLRGELSFKLRAPEAVLEGIQEGTLSEWHGPEVAAHLGVCKVCKEKVREFRELAEAQPWWQAACDYTLKFMEEHYRDKVSSFKRVLEMLRRMPAQMVERLAYRSPPSPIGAWGLGQEDVDEDREGIAVLAAFASTLESHHARSFDREEISDKELSRAIRGQLRRKHAPRALEKEVLAFLESQREGLGQQKS